MINITQYLEDRLKKAAIHSLSREEKMIVASQGIESFALKRLSSKKYRKQKLDPNCLERTKTAIHTQVGKNQPLKVIFPQGGYKLWRLPSSPEIDWAEFFNLSYVLEYLAPIAAAYPPGIEIVYYLHTLLMEKHDNLETSIIQSYVSSFQSLIDQFSKYLPHNVKISILRDADIYERDEYFECLESGRQKAIDIYQNFTPEKKADYQRMAKLNIKWQGQEPWHQLDEKGKQEKIYLASLYEIAATQALDRVFEKVKSPENILLFTKGTPDFIGIGSTKTSFAKFWVGYGVLESDSKNLYDRILTPSQLEKAKDMPHQEIPVSLFTLKNLRQIWVYPHRFNFTKV